MFKGLAPLLLAAACSSSGTSIVGEWRYTATIGGGRTSTLFFNTDGTYGDMLSGGGLPTPATACASQGSYTYDGRTLTTRIEDLADGGSGAPYSLPVTVFGNQLTMDGYTYMRVNSNSTNTCP